MKIVLKQIILPVVLILIVVVFSVGVSAQELNVGIPVEEYPELFLGRTMPTHGEGKIAVFLIQFPDCKNDNPDATAEYYNQLYFSAEPLAGNGNLWSGSVAAFYREQSFGKLNLSGQVFDWYTAEHERSYYDSIWRKMELIMEVIAYYEGKGVDFGQFDGDKNGEIDALIYHFAGSADQNMEDPWYDGVEYTSHVGKTGGGMEVNSFIQIDNKVDKESRNSEKLRRIICHELMHSLGLYDLYGKAWWSLEPVDDLMTTEQPFINPYYKMLLGWTDKIRVVTADTLDVQLGLWEETGEALLVTDSYNGIFDEFYLIAYTKYANTEGEIKIWHVDARLNEEKTAFLYSNLSYSPKPEQGDAHGEIWDYSTYLFMEEISANPQYDNVLNETHNLYFREGASLGPDSIPNTDTHDGRYTGIKIDDFKRLETCATMDITFGNRDTAAPRVSDELSLLGFSVENRVRFNEYVYPADNWSQIRVTTMIGETIPARILRSHYSVHEIEIIIEGDIPQEGYLIVLPEGCVRDSSGNLNQAKTVAITPDGIVFEQEKTLLPWYYPDEPRSYISEVYCFSDAGASVAITTTGKGQDEVKFIEFLKTDADGNVLAHKFILNPYEKCSRAWPIQTNDGSYLFVLFCREPSYRTYALCIDRDGNLLWYKEPEEILSASAVAYGDGILFYNDGGFTKDQIVYLDVRSGMSRRPR